MTKAFIYKYWALAVAFSSSGKELGSPLALFWDRVLSLAELTAALDLAQ
jgi:hypothetical protein